MSDMWQRTLKCSRMYSAGNRYYVPRCPLRYLLSGPSCHSVQCSDLVASGGEADMARTSQFGRS
jgi:hypothetical protein